MNKKGFFITPIIFIVFFIIAVLFSYYVTGLDKEISYGIQKSASVEKAIHDLQKEQLSQFYFVKTAAYDCAIDNPCNASIAEQCAKNKLIERFGESLGLNFFNESGKIYAEFEIWSFNARNINMTSDKVKVKTELNHKLMGC